jgi:N-carbamoyl-L-amino-acid hydrolase
VIRKPGRQVGTVGKIEVSPNAPNVVPGAATIMIELRDLSTVTLDSIAEEIRARAAAIATGTRTTIQLTPASANPPAFADTAVQDVVERAAQSLIFVPSIGGISHSPKELTRWEDCANGANVLLQSVLSLDRT